MVIFHCYVSLPEGICHVFRPGAAQIREGFGHRLPLNIRQILGEGLRVLRWFWVKTLVPKRTLK